MSQVTPAKPATLAGIPPVDKHKLFAEHFLLRHLRPEERDKLITYARLERHATNDVIFRKGSPGHGMMAVIKGRVKISSPSPDGKEVVLNVINPGEVFGEIALLDGKERTADATAMSECELLVLERRDFIPFLERHPEICVRLLAVLCERLRRTSEQVEDVLFLELPARLAKTLLRLAETHGKPAEGGTRIGLRLSQRELANMVGSSRESINKQLREWQREGMIDMREGAITLMNAPALTAVAEQ